MSDDEIHFDERRSLLSINNYTNLKDSIECPTCSQRLKNKSKKHCKSFCKKVFDPHTLGILVVLLIVTGLEIYNKISEEDYEHKYDNLEDKYNDLKENLKNLTGEYNNLTKEYNNLTILYNELKNESEVIKEQLDSLKNESDFINKTYHQALKIEENITEAYANFTEELENWENTYNSDNIITKELIGWSKAFYVNSTTNTTNDNFEVVGTMKVFGKRIGLTLGAIYGPSLTDGLLSVFGRLDGSGGLITVSVNADTSTPPKTERGYGMSYNAGSTYYGNIQFTVAIKKDEYYQILCNSNIVCGGSSRIGRFNAYFTPLGQ